MKIPLYTADVARQLAEQKDQDLILLLVTKAVKKIESEILNSSTWGYESCRVIVSLGLIGEDEKRAEISNSIITSLRDAGYRVCLEKEVEMNKSILGHFKIGWYE